MEHNKRARPDYRIFSSKTHEKPLKVNKRRKNKSDDDGKADRNLKKEDSHRVSLQTRPVTGNRFGHIFGNMRVSKKVKAVTHLEKDGRHAKPLLVSTATMENMPERMQRFLQEPTLVSFSHSPDDMAWLDEKSISEGGVSERQPVHHARSGDVGQDSRRQRSTRPPSSTVSPHPSQQSTAIKRLQASKSKKISKNTEKGPPLVSRGCSPIITYPPAELEKQYDHFVAQRNEAVQTAAFQFSPPLSDIGSLRQSVALDLPPSRMVRYDFQQDNIDRIYQEIEAEDERRAQLKRDENVGFDPANFGDWVPEKVVLSTGEVGYLIRASSAVLPRQNSNLHEMTAFTAPDLHHIGSFPARNLTSCENRRKSPSRPRPRTVCDLPVGFGPNPGISFDHTENPEKFEFKPNAVFRSPVTVQEEQNCDQFWDRTMGLGFPNVPGRFDGFIQSRQEEPINTISRSSLTQQRATTQSQLQATADDLPSSRASDKSPFEFRVYPRRMF